MNKKKTDRKQQSPGAFDRGRLRIGDNWNAITIIALSQSNPLKAIAEFVENSIDAGAGNISIIRGKEKGDHYLKIIDDGEGIRRDENGIPNFKYVATHICDSIKKQLKKNGTTGMQGEFGIGLLSFWTVGEKLSLMSSGRDSRTYQMRMVKGEPGYTINQKRILVPVKGTELSISPLLPGVRHISGEKIQRYLASELRDRIRRSKIRISITDRTARKEMLVEPRVFGGRLLHRLPSLSSALGEIYTELYINEASSENRVGLYRSGTRVLNSITDLDRFRSEPWTSGWLEGIIDVPFLNLTPGTRSGIIHDNYFAEFSSLIAPLEKRLSEIISEQRKAEEERASRKVLKSVQNALKEAILSLPREEYDWFDIHLGERDKPGCHPGEHTPALSENNVGAMGVSSGEGEEKAQKEFFEFAGPLYSVRMSPASSVVPVGTTRNFRAIPRDQRRRLVEEDLHFNWKIEEGAGTLENPSGEIAIFRAAEEPGLTTLSVTVRQGETVCTAEGLITVTDTIIPKHDESSGSRKGMPGYTFRRAPGELWRSQYDEKQNVIIINNGHRDFVYASKNRTRKLRYICRLFSKELVYRNFPGLPSDQLLERMIELSLYTEDYLK
ncbi:MAG: ATP-binding protein [Nitrospirota bacterium]|nr:ATP-binding protein [Nitrospirota bacterium]